MKHKSLVCGGLLSGRRIENVISYSVDTNHVYVELTKPAQLLRVLINGSSPSVSLCGIFVSKKCYVQLTMWTTDKSRCILLSRVHSGMHNAHALLTKPSDVIVL